MIKIHSKTELSERLKESVIAKISEYSGKNIEANNVEFGIDKNILGGIRIDIDTEVIDLTLNKKLEQVLEILTSENV